MPAALQPGRKTFKANLISFSFPSSMQRLKENDVKFSVFLFLQQGENLQEEKLFASISLLLFFKGIPNME